MSKKQIEKAITKIDRSLKKEKSVDSMLWKWQQLVALQKELNTEEAER